MELRSLDSPDFRVINLGIGSPDMSPSAETIQVLNPGYPTYASATRLVGGKIRTYSMRESLNCGIDVAALSLQDLSRV